MSWDVQFDCSNEIDEDFDEPRSFMILISFQSVYTYLFHDFVH